MDKILFQWYYSFLKMDTPEIMYYYYCFKKKYGLSQHSNNPTACGITAVAILQKIQNYYGGKFKSCTLLDAKKMILHGNSKILRLDVYSYNHDQYGIFPGHSIIVIPLGSEKYMLLQSYIGKYSLLEWMNIAHLVYSKKEIIELIDFFIMFETEEYFTRQMANIWYKYIKISIEHKIGHKIIKGNTVCDYLNNKSFFPIVNQKVRITIGATAGMVGGYLLSKL